MKGLIHRARHSMPKHIKAPKILGAEHAEGRHRPIRISSSVGAMRRSSKSCGSRRHCRVAAAAGSNAADLGATAQTAQGFTQRANSHESTVRVFQDEGPSKPVCETPQKAGNEGRCSLKRRSLSDVLSSVDRPLADPIFYAATHCDKKLETFPPPEERTCYKFFHDVRQGDRFHFERSEDNRLYVLKER